MSKSTKAKIAAVLVTVIAVLSFAIKFLTDDEVVEETPVAVEAPAEPVPEAVSEEPAAEPEEEPEAAAEEEKSDEPAAE